MMIKKGYAYITLLILIIGIAMAYSSSVPDPGHGGDKVLITISGYTMTLQEAVDNGFLIDGASPPTQSYTTQADPGHDLGKVFVSVDGSEMSLENAVSSSLCGSTSSSYSSSISLGHKGEEVLISSGGSEMTLQEAINAGEFCAAPCVPDTCSGLGYGCGTWDDGCGGSLNCGTCGVGEECVSGICVSTCGELYYTCRNGDVWSRNNCNWLSQIHECGNYGCTDGDGSSDDLCNDWYFTGYAPEHDGDFGDYQSALDYCSYYFPGSYACWIELLEELIPSGSPGTGLPAGQSWVINADPPNHCNLWTDDSSVVYGEVAYNSGTDITHTSTQCTYFLNVPCCPGGGSDGSVIAALNEQTGKSCNTICSDIGRTCVSVGTDTDGTNGKMWTTKIFVGLSFNCNEITADCNSVTDDPYPMLPGWLTSCGGYDTKWTYCSCSV